MIFKEKEEKYLFILTITITLVSGPLQLSSSSCAFYDRNTTIEQTTTTHELYEKNNSCIGSNMFASTGYGGTVDHHTKWR